MSIIAARISDRERSRGRLSASLPGPAPKSIPAVKGSLGRSVGAVRGVTDGIIGVAGEPAIGAAVCCAILVLSLTPGSTTTVHAATRVAPRVRTLVVVRGDFSSGSFRAVAGRHWHTPLPGREVPHFTARRGLGRGCREAENAGCRVTIYYCRAARGRWHALATGQHP